MASPKIDWRSISGPLQPTFRQPVMTVSALWRSVRSATDGAEWTSACCAVMIMAEAALVLALDTSTVVNVGLAQGERVLATATVTEQMAHAEQLMPLVSECLDVAGVRAADLDRLLVGVGPGPFTGLRVGVATAQVLSYVLGVELRGVCSLDVLAAQFTGASPEEFVVATDARRREVYCCLLYTSPSPRDRS